MNLVGREGELSVLNSALEEALSGRTQTATVTGESGIGKTFLYGVL
ncbi:MAG: DUF2791 family P-loop domain-containing protein [Chloroflexi bacterium]|jgi:predicted ATPase|nr:DUF2791 family P-loop domain-containing protein [Chloroflexota bacterium]MBT4142690.1 DUF2791 family P-loop domain-containing protein [Chloroflexota bacterium]MBT4340637.1 DUF2791 family P-loop domain-containing protein [Chloroflexota bacterium]MBT5253588.1 DUF2791 family P-loop domain-containing protein [Chloroflexota bacterium]MBT5476508.1 DUF2791 family P-loop domain-containing protein [Chloroflexota bacterium]